MSGDGTPDATDHDRWVHRLGRPLSRLLLAPAWRGTQAAQTAYVAAYSLGKSLAEAAHWRFLATRVGPGMTILDVGANIGFYALRMARRVGPSGRVHALEPDPVSYAMLARRAASHRNVVAVRTALGARAGEATLHCDPSNRADNRLHARCDRPAETFTVPVTTLDAYCAAAGLDRLDAVKIDVQGAEVAVLAGGRETLRRLRPAWILVEFAPELLREAGSSPEALWDAVADLGYRARELAGGTLLPVEDPQALTRRVARDYTDLLLEPAAG